MPEEEDTEEESAAGVTDAAFTEEAETEDTELLSAEEAEETVLLSAEEEETAEALSSADEVWEEAAEEELPHPAKTQAPVRTAAMHSAVIEFLFTMIAILSEKNLSSPAHCTTLCAERKTTLRCTGGIR